MQGFIGRALKAASGRWPPLCEGKPFAVLSPASVGEHAGVRIREVLTPAVSFSTLLPRRDSTHDASSPALTRSAAAAKASTR